MCPLLGMVGAPPLPVKDFLTDFKARNSSLSPAETSVEGWGVSGFSQGRAVYFGRSAQSAEKEPVAFDVAAAKAQKSLSPVFIAHVRQREEGVSQVSNSHPFHWRDWMFAHAGTLFNPEGLKLEEATPQGSTGSERFGLWLIERTLPSLDPTSTLIDLLQDASLRLKFSALTFLLSDGKTLWAYREVSEENVRKKETAAERENHASLYLGAAGAAQLVCSQPLETQSVGWESIAQKTLAILTPSKAPSLIHIQVA